MPARGPGRDPGLEELVSGLAGGDRVALARAITLVESRRPEDRRRARALLERVLPSTGGARRVGITGAPGVGKSTFIDALGSRLVEAGHRVAVLAVDPTSTVSGGSILGDKSRMPRLAASPEAFVRPSPSALTPGGVGRRTRESILLCEAAGYDVVLVETVGVGQGETVVAGMVDLFLVLLQPGAGDELQGIKKGVLELADLVAVTKADGELLASARASRREYGAALRYLAPRSGWQPRVVTVSALTGEGLDELWELIEERRRALGESGELEARRRRQRRDWLWSRVEERLLERFRAAPEVAARLAAAERAVEAGEMLPEDAVDELLAAFTGETEKA